MQRVLVVGGYSAIAEAVARIYAVRGAAVFLVGRDLGRVEAVAADLRVRGASRADAFALDVNDIVGHAAMLEAAAVALGGIDVALLAHGTLPAQQDCDASVDTLLREFSTNGTSTIALCARLAPMLRPDGTLAVISSVAGDRGRASNHLYGSAKAAVDAYLSGLRQRLHASGVNVLTIKPGFVDTPMTRSFRKGPLWAKPATIARGIVRAIDRRRSVAYLPRFWWAIMAVIRHIPEPVFRRMKL